MTVDTNKPYRRSPGQARWQLRVLLFVLLFGAFCAGAASFIKYHAAAITATTIPTATHTVKVIQAGRTLYFSEQQWNQVRLLGLSSVGLGMLGVVGIVLSLRLHALLRSVFRAFDTKAPIWDATEPPPLPPSNSYRWFGIVMFGLAVLLMVLIVMWEFTRWIMR
jgi:hypothetical protein